jgi:glycogen debranching enzyme
MIRPQAKQAGQQQEPAISQKTGEVIPARKKLVDLMDIELTVNDKSEVCLLHSKPFSEILRWAEYDLLENKIYLVSVKGNYHELGIVIPNDMKDLIVRSNQMNAIHLANNGIQDFYFLPLIIQHFGRA